MDPRLKRLYWQLTALLLAAHFAGAATALPGALALNVAQALHFAAARRGLRAFDVQVRVGYLALLLIGSVGPLWPLHLVQFVGVNAMLVADYCLLARLLRLAPWNRREPMSLALVRWALLAPPAPGSMLVRRPA
jgi:hypothetical protein